MTVPPEAERYKAAARALALALPLVWITAAVASPGPRPPYASPGLTPSDMPSAFVAEWGDLFATASAYSYRTGSKLTPIVDGAINLGGGIGSRSRDVAIEIDLNMPNLDQDLSDLNLDLRVGRDLIRSDRLRLSIGAGWLAFLTPEGLSLDTTVDSAYLVVSGATPLRPAGREFRQTLQMNLGAGSGKFEPKDPFLLKRQGLFGSVGVELAPNLGLSVGWLGRRGLISGVSLVPWRGTPLFLSLSAVNTLDRDSGRAYVLSATWGGSFRTQSF